MSIKKIKRKKGIVWEVRLQDSRGVDYYKTFPKKVLAEEYEKSERLKKYQGYVSSVDGKLSKKTIHDLCDEYRRLQYPKLRDGSRMSYSQYMNNHIIPCVGELRVGNLKKKDVTLFENMLLRQKYSIQTIHNIIFFLITLVNYAAEELHWINKNIIKNYKPKKLEKSSEPVFWTKEEVDYFLNHKEVKNNYYYDLYIFLLNTGCRIGEACGLRLKDINFNNRSIYIGWTLSKNDYKNSENEGIYFSLNRQKGANDRIIPMNDTIYNLLLKNSKGKKDSDFLFTNKPQENRKIVFKDGNNKQYLIQAPVVNSQHFSHQRFKAIQKRINLNEERVLGAHGLRHTFASHYVMNGGNIYVLSKLLGHSSIQITEVYAHLAPDFLMDIGNYINFS